MGFEDWDCMKEEGTKHQIMMPATKTHQAFLMLVKNTWVREVTSTTLENVEAQEWCMSVYNITDSWKWMHRAWKLVASERGGTPSGIVGTSAGPLLASCCPAPLPWPLAVQPSLFLPTHFCGILSMDLYTPVHCLCVFASSAVFFVVYGAVRLT
jgi:hypothetical protein